MVNSYFVVSNENGSPVLYAVMDLVNFIGSKSQGADSEDLRAALQQLEAIFDSEEKHTTLPESSLPIFVKIAEHSGALLKASPTDFEAVMNLLWYVLSSAPNFDEVIPIALKQFTEPFPSVYGQQVALLAALSSLFNVAKPTSPQKSIIFERILDLAKITKSVDQFVPQLPQLAEWLQAWNLSPETKEKLVIQLSEGISRSESAELRAFLTSVVSSDPTLTKVATLLVNEELASRSIYGSAKLVDIPGVQALKGNGSDLFEALSAIVNGDYAKFAALKPEVSQNSAYVRKARVATVGRLASSCFKSKELSYKTISESIYLPVSEVEPVIVDGIKAELFKGRMSQIKQVFFVESASVVGPVTEEHWDTIEDRLAAWKKSLSTLVEISEKARNKLDLVKSLNKSEVN